MKKITYNFFGGLILGFIMELILIAGDAVDEFVLDIDNGLSFILMIAVPVVLFLIFCINNIKSKPPVNQVIKWGAGVAVAGIVSFIYGLMCEPYNIFPFEQTRDRCMFLCMNGIEYMLYPIIAFGGLLVICIIYLLILYIVKSAKNRKCQE
ncbi:MAG: hypothetical protein PUB67_01190 [Clostridiales bacterium]|nr:hypothetical protein [Clostridiales bacterium]